MKELWEKYSALYNARIIRERIIIALCILAAVYLAWDLSVLGSLREKRSQLDLRYQSASVEITKQLAEKSVLTKALLNNPGAKKQREIIQLTARLKALDNKIETQSVGLIAADKLPIVLRDVLHNTGSLELLGMVAHPPEKLRFSSPEDDDETGDEEPADTTDAGVYKHRVVFRLAGSYFTVKNYLTALETSDWHFYWSSLDYVVKQYPEAVVQLEVYTLSTDKGFMGE